MCYLVYLLTSYFHVFARTKRIEQRYSITFCVALEDSQAETIRKLQKLFKDNSMSVVRIKKWFNHYKNGQIFVESEPQIERPSTSRNEQINDQVRGQTVVWQ